MVSIANDLVKLGGKNTHNPLPPRGKKKKERKPKPTGFQLKVCKSLCEILTFHLTQQILVCDSMNLLIKLLKTLRPWLDNTVNLTSELLL